MTAPRHSADSAGAGNLFVEADPEPRSAGTESALIGPAHRSRRGRILVIPIDAPPGSAISPSAARFTCPNGGIGRLSASVQAQLRAADVRAGTLLCRLAGRRYAPLVAATALAAMLIALSWLGLALRDASTARDSAERARIAAAAALRRDRARIAGLTAQLTRTEVNVRRHQQASAMVTATWRARAIAAEHKLATNHHRRRR